MQTETKKTTVLINGVSVASLCLALGLARHQIPFLLVDEKSEIKFQNQLVILFPSTISQLRKIDVRPLIEEDIQEITSVHYFVPSNDRYLHSMSFTREVINPVAIELGTLLNALIDLLEEYDQYISRDTSIMDYKNKKDHSVCTMFDTKEKFLCKAQYLVAAKNRDNTLIVQSPLSSRNISRQFYMWEARFSQMELSALQENETGSIVGAYPTIKEKSIDPGNINILLDNNKSLMITDFFNEVILHFVSPELLQEAEVERELDRLLTIAFSKLGKKTPDLEITQNLAFQSYTSNLLQYHGMCGIGESLNSYPNYHHTINQSCADADNLIRKIITTEKFPHAQMLVNTYSLERVVSHKTDHILTEKVAKTLYRSGFMGFGVNLAYSFALKKKKLKQCLRENYLGTHDEYPESDICVEEYPSFKDMAPRNRVTDVTWIDGWSFFNGPKAGYQAPHGFLVLESNEAKQNRRDLLTNEKHILLIFDGLKSKKTEELMTLKDELSQDFDDFMQCYRITTHYDISEHDGDTSILGDPDGQFHATYKAKRASYYLIRPDGVIAFRSCGLMTDKLRSYITKIIGTKEEAHI